MAAVDVLPPKADAMDTDVVPTLTPADASTSGEADEDLYTSLKNLQRQLEFLEIQEEYIKEEQKNLKRELLRAQEEVKRIQSVPLVIGQFLEMVDVNNGIVGSTTGSNYYVRILSTLNRELLKPSASVALHRHSNALVDILPPEADSSISLLGEHERPDVTYADIGGYDMQKQEIREAVELPLVQADLYKQIGIDPPRGVLLYGPPGTGKTMLAKAVAHHTTAAFIRVVGSEFVQKYLGEGPRMVRDVFRLAKENAPSIIFIDEVDSLCSVRGDNESEAARRIKTQLMIEIQGVGSNNNRVLVLGATNLPYNLDQAIRRRFDKRIYIPLPEETARGQMFRIHLGDTPNTLTDEDYRELGRRTEGFSGSDVSVAVKDVLMQPIRLLREATHFKRVRGPDGGEAWEPCSPGDAGAQEHSLSYFSDNGLADKVIPPCITMRDFEKVLLRARPTVGKSDLEVFERFTAEFGEEAM